MPIAAKDNTDRVEQLIALTEKLLEMTETENRLLTERRPSEIAQSIADKGRLANLYTHEMSKLKRDPSLTKDVAPSLLQKLKDLTGRFRDQLKSQAGKVQTLREVTEGMIRAVAGHADEQRKPVTGYAKGGAFNRAKGPSTIALNQVI